MKIKLYFVSTLLLMYSIAASVGCQKQAATENQGATKSDVLHTLSDDQIKQKELALAARDKLATSLMGELMQSLGDYGPAKSIKVCQTRAPEIAAEVSQEQGVRIGRTSFLLRNASNQPPDWAQPFVQDRVAIESLVKLPDQSLGALLPIHLKATCMLCHGPQDQILSEVKAAIVSNYPEDQATGFAEGDLRGYFWVEVPPLTSE